MTADGRGRPRAGRWALAPGWLRGAGRRAAGGGGRRAGATADRTRDGDWRSRIADALGLAAYIDYCCGIRLQISSKHLYLWGNAFGDEGALAIAAALPHLLALDTLQMEHTGNVTNDQSNHFSADVEESLRTAFHGEHLLMV